VLLKDLGICLPTNLLSPTPLPNRIVMSDLDSLRDTPLDDLLENAWNIRSANFPPTLSMSAPSAKTFDSDFYRNRPGRFVNVSVTGSGCALDCEHCKGGLLESMVPVGTGPELVELGKGLVAKGCEGVLISGGATKDGEVPLDDFFDPISKLKEMGLKVLVHTGLATSETAQRVSRLPRPPSASPRRGPTRPCST